MNIKKWLFSNISLFVGAIILCMNPFQRSFAEENNSAVGYWKTIDDNTHQARSIVHIWENNNILYGKIVKIFYKPGESEKDLCTKCEGEDKDKPILGLTILRHFSEHEGDVWSKGTILDPESGKVYSSKLTLKNKGDELDVRGYIGISLIGRSQTWLRVDE